MNEFKIGKHLISEESPTFFIAEIGSNFDGDFTRAIDLIHLAKECGADAVKFQHYTAGTLVNDVGFKQVGKNASHQKEWKGSVYDVYEKASLNFNWTAELYKAAKDAGLIFFTSPYSFDLVDKVNPFVEAFKLGSGDISWLKIAEYMASKGKPLLIATGASDFADVERVYKACSKLNKEICLMQCNTNYTVDRENFKYINLNVLKTFREKFPKAILGLSDHTPGHETVLGAITLGARIIEKHFTDDKSRPGPDHKFAMDPHDWKQMVESSRNLELSLGDGIKKVEKNEMETKVVQRRSICINKDLEADTRITLEDLDFLRPHLPNSFHPYQTEEIIGKYTTVSLPKGTVVNKDMFK